MLKHLLSVKIFKSKSAYRPVSTKTQPFNSPYPHHQMGFISLQVWTLGTFEAEVWLGFPIARVAPIPIGLLQELSSTSQ